MVDKLTISLKYIYSNEENKQVKHVGLMASDFDFEKPINKNAKVWQLGGHLVVFLFASFSILINIS